MSDSPVSTVNWGRAIIAGVATTVILTISMWIITGANIISVLGGMIVGGGGAAAIIVGTMMHFGIGIVYGIVFASLVAPVTNWGKFTQGAIFCLAITAIALALMPIMASAMAGSGMAGGAAEAMNPCNQCSPANMCNPCNPCSMAAANPCNPCGGGGSAAAGLQSLINHVIFGLSLAYLYKGRE